MTGEPAAGPPLGLALCGGRSTRMGRDKALAPWGSTDLLGHAVARLAAAAGEVAILSGKQPRYEGHGRPVVPDGPEGDGPAAGLLAGLLHAGGRPVLLLAVDLPLVPVALLRWLLSVLPGWDAVVPLSPGGAEPLCAAYGPACLAALRARVAQGENRMTAFWPDVRVRRAPAAELRAFGDPATMRLNVNDPADLDRASRISSR